MILHIHTISMFRAKKQKRKKEMKHILMHIKEKKSNETDNYGTEHIHRKESEERNRELPNLLVMQVGSGQTKVLIIPSRGHCLTPTCCVPKNAYKW